MKELDNLVDSKDLKEEDDMEEGEEQEPGVLLNEIKAEVELQEQHNLIHQLQQQQKNET